MNRWSDKGDHGGANQRGFGGDDAEQPGDSGGNLDPDPASLGLKEGDSIDLVAVDELLLQGGALSRDAAPTGYLPGGAAGELLASSATSTRSTSATEPSPRPAAPS
jgi:hypothetical protein